MQSRTRRATLAAGAGLAALAPAGVAQAHTVYPTQGTTRLALSAGAAEALRGLGITASGTRYRVSGGQYSFHELNDGGGGSLEHRGTLTLRRGATAVRLTRPTIRIEGARRGRSTGVLVASVGGTRLGVAALDLARYEPGEDDPGFTGARLRLTAKAAAALDRAFGTTAFERGLGLGSLRVSGVAQPLRFTGGETRVTLDPKAVQAIASAGASLAPLTGTQGAGTQADPLVFPVTTSRLDYVSFRGNVLHRGGLRFTAPAGKTVGDGPSLDLRAFSVAYEEEGFVLRAGGAKGTPLFRIELTDDGELGPRPALSITGIELYPTKEAAALLAPALGQSAATLRRLRIGTATLRATYGNGS